MLDRRTVSGEAPWAILAAHYHSLSGVGLEPSLPRKPDHVAPAAWMSPVP